MSEIVEQGDVTWVLGMAGGYVGSALVGQRFLGRFHPPGPLL